MQWIDWLIVAVTLSLVAGIGLYTQRYLKSVADFMAGNRLAGRYLLCVARGEMQGGAVMFIAMFEVFAKAGFTYTWWAWMQIPVSIFTSMLGFVIYRYRETRAFTLAQFFQLRYSKGFRLFTGGLGFVAGIMNFGIIPAVEARFFVYFLGMPATLPVLGFNLPTYIPVMAILMLGVLWLTLSGGQITVMITDCTEGLISYFFYLFISFTLLAMIDWSQVVTALSAAPPGESMLNPFDSTKIKDFNIFFVMMSIALNVYGTMAWQNASGYTAAGLNAHETKMGGLLGRWRDLLRGCIIAFWGVFAFTFLSAPEFAKEQIAVAEALSHVPQEQIREQMRIPVALAYMLPAGIKGLLCALFVMGVFGGQTTHLHSWGGILVQDLVVPLRKKPFSPKQHIRVLRTSICGVAVFAVIFGALFRQTEYIVMWWQITTAIFVGGAGSAIIGGLYWKKGTTAGAWAATVTGCVLALTGILIRQFNHDFFLNGTQISFSVMLISITTYVIVSLATCREDYNLDRLLHRGEYAIEGDSLAPVKGFRFRKLFGIDDNFNFRDKLTSIGIFGWSLVLLGIFLFGTIWNVLLVKLDVVEPWSVETWSSFWWVMAIVIPMIMAVGTTVWFSIGVGIDMKRFFHRLRTHSVNHLDDGTVVGHQNLAETAAESDAPPEK